MKQTFNSLFHYETSRKQAFYTYHRIKGIVAHSNCYHLNQTKGFCMDFSNHFMDAESFQSIFKHKTLVPVGPQTNFLTALTADGDLAGYINFEHNIDTETLYFISTETLVS